MRKPYPVRDYVDPSIQVENDYVKRGEIVPSGAKVPGLDLRPKCREVGFDVFYFANSVKCSGYFLAHAGTAAPCDWHDADLRMRGHDAIIWGTGYNNRCRCCQTLLFIIGQESSR